MLVSAETLQLIPHSHKSMIAYLASINALQSAEILEKELPVDNTFDVVARKKYEGLLARKWTNVMRLQRRVRYVPGPLRYRLMSE